MTELDVRNYLTKIYKLPVVEVRSVVRSKMGNPPGNAGDVIKEEDYRLAYVTMPVEFKFVYPDIFPADKVNEDVKDENQGKEAAKTLADKHTRQHWDRVGVPPWYSFWVGGML